MTIEPSDAPGPPTHASGAGASGAGASSAGVRAGGQCARHPERTAQLRCARCGDNLCDSCALERIDGVCKACIERLSTRGKVPHVEWLAIVTGVHGGLLLMYALLLAVYGAAFGYSFGTIEPTRADGPPPELLAGVMGGTMLVMMLGMLVPGVLQLVAAFYMHKFRYRALAIVALLSGAMSIIGCYCFPTALIVGIWGMVVLLDGDVAARFAAATAEADRDAVS